MRQHDHPVAPAIAPPISSSAEATQPDWAEGTALGVPSTFENFGCDVPQASPDTPDRVTPDVVIEREFYGDLDLAMPDGRRIRMWGFEDPTSSVRKPFPSAPMRVRQGQVVHTRLKVSKGAHTIHHHGIEPIPFNDGVGHMSFEANPRYTYQWKANQAGSYFYHCHVNTVLHVQMGMYGLLVVDPPEGPGRAFAGGPAYDTEAFWVADDIDPTWHDLSHGAALCGGDAGLNRFNPRYFLITGVPAPRTLVDPRVAVRAKVGQSILIRTLNASYSIVRLVIDGLDAQCVAVDGRPLQGRYSHPFVVRSGQALELSSAQRYDLMVRPERPGVYPARLEFRHWITGKILGRCDTTITVD